MGLLTKLIEQLYEPHAHKADGAERQAKHLAARIEREGIAAVRQKYRESYYRRREAILARYRDRRREKNGER